MNVSDKPELGPFVVMPEARARELHKAEERVTSLLMNGSAQLRALREELAVVRKALEFYADRASWRPRGLAPKVLAHDDHGHRARKALGME